MQLLDDAENLLKNTTLSVLATPTSFGALHELPPPVVAGFWKVIDAAVRVVDRAREDRLLGEGGERENLDKLCTMLTRTLKLYNDALRRAAIPEAKLEKQLEKWHPEPELEEVLLRRYFYQIRGLMARTVEYAQAVLDAYDKHPVFVMDVNFLLDAIERFTGYVRNSGGARPETSNMDTLYLLRAIAGEADTWLDRTSPFSEFNMLSGAANTTPEKWKDRGRDADDTRRYLAGVWSGISAGEVGELRDWQEKAWADKKLNPKIKYARDQAAFPEARKEEREMWFFINGVVTDHWIAQLNAEHLADVFKRPVHILHNPTEGLHRDVRECVRGRILQQRVAIAEKLRRELVDLAGRERDRTIVLIAHSQGTILASEIVKQLRDQRSSLLPRMNVFNFAFCADEFPGRCCQTVEHFVNDNDFVPAFSLVPGNPYNVPGKVFRRAGAWGHFLGAHYLDGLPRGAYRDENGDHRTSVLFDHIGGARYGVWP